MIISRRYRVYNQTMNHHCRCIFTFIHLLFMHLLYLIFFTLLDIRIAASPWYYRNWNLSISRHSGLNDARAYLEIKHGTRRQKRRYFAYERNYVRVYESHTKVLYIACLGKLPANICYAVSEPDVARSTMETSCFDKDLYVRFDLRNQSYLPGHSSCEEYRAINEDLIIDRQLTETETEIGNRRSQFTRVYFRLDISRV